MVCLVSGAMDCKSRSCILSTGRWTLIYIVFHFVSLVRWTLKSFEIPFPFRYFTTKSKLDGSGAFWTVKPSSSLHFTAVGMPSKNQHGSQISIVNSVFPVECFLPYSHWKDSRQHTVAVIPRCPWNSPIILEISHHVPVLAGRISLALYFGHISYHVWCLSWCSDVLFH